MTVDIKPFTISRTFDAPRSTVFKVHSDAEHLAKWLSPTGFKNIHTAMDFKPGGTYHYGLEGPNNMQMWGMQKFVEIVPDQKVVHIQSFSDKDGGMTRHPMADTWPLEMHATTTFEDAGDGATKLTISWKPHNSDEAGNATFEGARGQMEQGFSGTFDKLQEYLATLKK